MTPSISPSLCTLRTSQTQFEVQHFQLTLSVTLRRVDSRGLGKDLRLWREFHDSESRRLWEERWEGQSGRKPVIRCIPMGSL